MQFGEKFRRTMALSRQCWQLLSANLSLLVLPALSGVILLVVIASFALPIVASEEFRRLVDGQTPDTEFVDYAYGFLFYLVAFTAINFFNAALVFCVLSRLRGGHASVADGLGLAARRIPQIVGWSLVSATVGLVLNILRDRAGVLGSLVSGLAGLAWSVATYFVVPVLVVEGIGPLEAVRRSTAMVRRTWGESLVANFGLAVLFILGTLAVAAALFLVFTALALAASMMGANLPAGAIIAVAALFGIAWALMILVFNTMSVILQTAIYDYAANGEAAGPFDKSEFAAAFTPRR